MRVREAPAYSESSKRALALTTRPERVVTSGGLTTAASGGSGGGDGEAVMVVGALTGARRCGCSERGARATRRTCTSCCRCPVAWTLEASPSGAVCHDGVVHQDRVSDLELQLDVGLSYASVLDRVLSLGMLHCNHRV